MNISLPNSRKWKTNNPIIPFLLFFIFFEFHNQNVYILNATYTPIGIGSVIMKECMDSENLHRRLKKIIGQINAIDRMIDEDIPCEQILMQVNASKSALHKVGHIIVEGHLEHCVKQAIKEEDADEAISDISSILEYYSRL